MNRGKLVMWGFLILALAFFAQIGGHMVVPAPTHEAANSGLVQDAESSLPYPVSTPTSTGTNYYVDSVNGSDSNPGTIDKPWRTLAPIHARDFLPGNVVHFRRGSSWTGGLVIDDSGVEGSSITFKAYGTGEKPVFRNPGAIAAVTIDADWVVVEGLLVRDSHEAGIYITKGSDHNIVSSCEVTDVGDGVVVAGQYNLITNNYVHDLHMVVNTVGGNDDCGARGVNIRGKHNEISYNRMVNCIAQSYDYGVDGGAVELAGVVDGSYIHHNWATSNEGFMEVFGGSAIDVVVAYNISVGNNSFGVFHLGGTFGGDVENFRAENNTIVDTNDSLTVIGFYEGDPSLDTFIMRNNIIYVNKPISNKSSFSHDHNLYYRIDGSTDLGFSLGEGEMITDPVFVDLAGQDFHLRSGSPAIDAGVDLGHPLDFYDRSVPAGVAPDIGASEYWWFIYLPNVTHGAAPLVTAPGQPLPSMLWWRVQRLLDWVAWFLSEHFQDSD